MIIIDDGSPDGTLEAAKQLQNIYGKEHIVCDTVTDDLVHRYVLFYLFVNAFYYVHCLCYCSLFFSFFTSLLYIPNVAKRSM